MADLKITQLPVSTGVSDAELIAVVDSPGSTPQTQKATRAQLLAGIPILIFNDETDSTEQINSTSESAALKTFNLPINTYSKVLIEAIVRSRFESDVTSRSDYTWRIKVGGATVRTFVERIIALNTAGADSGDRQLSTISTIVAGGQGSVTAITITVQMNTQDVLNGGLVHVFRVYGIY